MFVTAGVVAMERSVCGKHRGRRRTPYIVLFLLSADDMLATSASSSVSIESFADPSNKDSQHTGSVPPLSYPLSVPKIATVLYCSSEEVKGRIKM